MKHINRIFIITLLLVLSLPMAAKIRTIKGTVFDGTIEGEPLVGATVSYGKGRALNGTITDYDGNFTLEVPDSVTSLNISFVGYISQVILLQKGKNDGYTLTLEADKRFINEVVITTGYQNIDRRKLTSAVSKLEISDATVVP